MENWRIKDSETPQEVLERIRDKILEIAAENEGKTVAVASHGYAIRLLLGYAEGYSLKEMGTTPNGYNTAVSLLEVENGNIKLLYRDDISHLDAPEFIERRNQRKDRSLDLYFEPPRLDAPWLITLTAGIIEQKDLKRSEPYLTVAGYFVADEPNRRFVADEPVGVLRLNPKNGEIQFLIVREKYRRYGFATQFIGQALQIIRKNGGEYLSIAIPKENQNSKFFEQFGFLLSEELEAKKILKWKIPQVTEEIPNF